MSDIDSLKRYQTGDVRALVDAVSDSSEASPVTYRMAAVAAATEAPNASAFAQADDVGPSTAQQSGDEPSPPGLGSKLAALVIAIVLGLLLAALAVIGLRLRRHRKHAHHDKHSSRHKHSHRFIAYDADRQ